MKDVLKDIYTEFPEIDEKSIDKICKAGLAGINRAMRLDEELIIRGANSAEIKFFIPCSPEVQDKITKANRGRRRYKENNKNNGEKSQ